MTELRNKLIIIFTTLMIIIGWGVGFLLNEKLSIYNTSWYPAIPVFFFVVGSILIYSITKQEKTKTNNAQKKLVNKYMLLRVVKLALGLFLLLIHWLLNREEIRTFAIIFVIFYMFYLIFETFAFIKVEKRLKTENNKN